MHTKTKGNRCEGVVLATLLKAGKNVLTPFGELHRYDLVEETNGKFERIQCKSGRYINGCVVFNAYSLNDKDHWQSYKGQIEKFGIYCHQTGKVYMVPIEILGDNDGDIVLRVEPPKNNQKKKIRWAKDFEI